MENGLKLQQMRLSYISHERQLELRLQGKLAVFLSVPFVGPHSPTKSLPFAKEDSERPSHSRFANSSSPVTARTPWPCQ